MTAKRNQSISASGLLFSGIQELKIQHLNHKCGDQAKHDKAVGGEHAGKDTPLIGQQDIAKPERGKGDNRKNDLHCRTMTPGYP